MPNAVGAVGLILIARRSDRTGEQHFACCTIGGERARGADAASAQLRGDARVPVGRGDADLRRIADLLGGADPLPVGQRRRGRDRADQQHRDHERDRQPWVIGMIRTRTGSMDLAVYLLAALLVASGVALMLGVKGEAAPRD